MDTLDGDIERARKTWGIEQKLSSTQLDGDKADIRDAPAADTKGAIGQLIMHACGHKVGIKAHGKGLMLSDPPLWERGPACQTLF